MPKVSPKCVWDVLTKPAEVSMLRKKNLLYLLIVFAMASCMQKRVWQGQYITLKTNEYPKEDFRAGGYIVVSYSPQEYNKSSKVIYRFDAMQNGKTERMFEFSECTLLITTRPAPNVNDKGKDYDYALMEISPEYFKRMQHSLMIQGTTHKLYQNVHSYEEIKQEVIYILTDEELLPEE